MTNSETTGPDEPVSNRTTQLEDHESAAPEKGPGRPGRTKGEMESVAGYLMPSPRFEAEARAVTVDTALETAYSDIGAASFGGSSPRTVHGVDDRRQITTTGNYPWRAHASLLITAGDGSRWIGTAWFIAPRVLITAGHVVCIKGSGVPGRDGWVTSIRVFPGRNGIETPFGEVTSTTFHSVRGWVENGNEEYDYGAIVLEQPLGNETGWLSFGRYSDDDLKSVVGNICGYPGDKAPGTQWYAARRIGSVTARKVRYDIDTAGGQSGAAVYRIKQGKRYAIAIHAYGGATTNSGTRINRPVFDNLSKWKADNA